MASSSLYTSFTEVQAGAKGRECTTWFACNGDMDTFFSWLTGTPKRYQRAHTRADAYEGDDRRKARFNRPSDTAQPVSQQDRDRRSINGLNSQNVDGPEGHAGPTQRIYFYNGRGDDHNYFDDVNVQNGQLINSMRDMYAVLGYDIARSLEVAMKYSNARED